METAILFTGGDGHRSMGSNDVEGSDGV